MPDRKILVPFACAVMMAACQTTPEGMGEQRVGPDYVARSIQSGADSISLAMGLHDVDGKIALCAAFKVVSSSLARADAIKRYIQNTSVIYEGEVLSDTLRFARQTSGDIRAARVGCALTDRDAPEALEPRNLKLLSGGSTSYHD